MGLTVAVTGPTGEIGRSVVAALEREPQVEAILGMARRPFSPAAHGWTRTDYRQGDVLDRAAVDALVATADVVVHLAYVIMGSRAASRQVNLRGTHCVVEAALASPRVRRLVYTSSVAAYGYHADNPSPITEDVPARGSPEHYYSEQKAECEALVATATAGSSLAVYLLRPCIVAGPTATVLADSMPWRQLADRVPGALRRLVAAVPVTWPLLPDPGAPLQLVHQDDVATAVVAATLGAGPPGAYNLAGDGTVTLTQVAAALGVGSIRVPRVTAVAASAMVARLPLVPASLEWVHVARTPVVMDTTKAWRELGWRPAYTSEQTLQALAAAVRPA